MRAHRLALTTAAVFAALMVGSVSSLAGPTYVELGTGTSFSYMGVPFERLGVYLLTIKTDTSFVPTQMLDLSAYTADEIHIIEAAGWSDNVPDGVVVGHINVYYQDGSSEGLDLETGVNIAEWAYDRVELQPFLQHSKITPAYSYLATLDSAEPYSAHNFYVSIDTELKPLDYLELVLDPVSYTGQTYYGYAPADYFAICIKAITLEVPGQVPAPGAIVLGSIGVGFVGWLRRRRTL